LVSFWVSLLFIVGVTEKVAPTITGKYRWQFRHVSGRLFRHPDTVCCYWFLFGVSPLFIVGVTEKVAPTITASANKSN
jgi:hypothetical protein